MNAPSRVDTQVAQVHSLRMALICLGCGVLAVPLISRGNFFLHVVVAGQLACACVPFWYRWVHHKLDYFESIHLFNILCFVFFGLGALWLVDDPGMVAYDLYLAPYVPRAAFYCLLGQIAMNVAYFGPWHGFGRAKTAPEWPIGPWFLLGVGGIGFVGYLAWNLVERSAHLGSRVLTSMSPIAQLAPIFLYAWGVTWLVYYSGRMTRGQRLVMFGFMFPAAAFVLYATVSDKSLLMTFVGIPIIARWYQIRRMPWAALLVMLLILIFIVFPMYNTYRWFDPHLGTGERLSRTYDFLQSSGSQDYLRFSIGTFKARVALINSVAVVVRDVGRWVPFARGETILLPTLALLVPRYLWPGKPIVQFGREFGRLFRVTDYLSRDTYIAVTIPGELYWNFHVPGVIAGMGLLGFALRRLFLAYGDGRESDPARQAVHLLILVEIAHGGGSLAADAASLLRMLLLIAALRMLGRRIGWLGASDRVTTVGTTVGTTADR